jgi:hypothetical protein
MYGDGTSFACPLTAGVAGLVRSHFPALSPQGTAQQIVATGDVVPYDQPIGPRVNAFRALTTLPVAVGEPDAPQALEIPDVVPNPSHQQADIHYGIAREGVVRLALYDAAGRLVRELATGTMPAGRHFAVWDGRDRFGRAAASGLYFVRLENGGRTVQRKLIRLER